MGVQPQVSRVCSLIKVALPKARRAAYRASFGDKPFSRCSSSSNSRSERNSRSRSASLFFSCHHLISTLLGGAPHHSWQSLRRLLPLRFNREYLNSRFLCLLCHGR